MNQRISTTEKMGYLGLEVGLQFVWTMVSTYLSAFYTDVVGIAPALVSIILLVARIWDGVNDPMMGIIANKTNTKFGKYRPYIIFGAPVLALTSILTFTKFTDNSTLSVVLATVTYIACGMAYTAVCISQGSIVNVMTEDVDTRVQLNALRQMGNGITGLILGAIAMPMILFFGNGSTSNANGYFFTNLILAVIGLACLLFGGIVCKERLIPKQGQKVPGLKESFLYIAGNRDVLLICINGIFTAGSILGRMGTLYYYFTYYIGNPRLMATSLMVYNIVTILSQLIVPWITKVMDKKMACVCSYVLQAVSLVMFFFLGDKGTVWILISSFIMGASNFAPGILYSIAGEIADKEEVEKGFRSDGVIYSMLSLGTKIGLAVGGSISLALLQVIGFVANEEQTAETLSGINLITNIAPVVFVFFAALCVGLIHMTNKESDENRRILNERRANNAG